MKRILVFGASGFLGSAISKKLASEGYDVKRVSRTERPGFLTLSKVCDLPDADIVIHLAEESDRAKVSRMGESYQQSCYNFVDQLVRKYEGKVIYASSAVIYGDKNLEAHKELDPVSISDLYSEIKIRNEGVVANASGVVLRFSNIYGEGMSPNNVLSDILKQLDGPNPIVLRDTSPIRDFIDLDSVCSLLVSIVKNFEPGIYNVGTGTAYSIYYLATQVVLLFSNHTKDIVAKNPSTNLSVNFLDISKAQKTFSWLPNRNFEEILSRLIKSKRNG